MAKQSAGILVYRWRGGAIEVFLVHPGGPFWANKEQHAWSIPKGELDPGDENLLAAARREFTEETGFEIDGDFRALTPRKQPGGKRVHAFAVEGDCDPEGIASNSFAMEWPPRSGQTREFPEVDRAAWFDLETARQRILKGQIAFLDELEDLLSDG